MLEIWKTAPNRWSEESTFALLTDEMTDGWKGLRKYWELFEPECYATRKSPYSRVSGLNKDPEKIYFRNAGHPWKF